MNEDEFDFFKNNYAISEKPRVTVLRSCGPSSSSFDTLKGAFVNHPVGSMEYMLLDTRGHAVIGKDGKPEVCSEPIGVCSSTLFVEGDAYRDGRVDRIVYFGRPMPERELKFL